MTLPFTLPDWVPWWLQTAGLVVALLFALAFVLMPFSVFGVKGRLEAVEARLDEIQGEIRSLALRLPEPARGGSLYDEDLVRRQAPRAEEPDWSRPPIPPAPRIPASIPPGEPADRAGDRTTERVSGRGRAEPRLNWPR